jgi:hypothetical protein
MATRKRPAIDATSPTDPICRVFIVFAPFSS